jgi:hypothetical protein
MGTNGVATPINLLPATFHLVVATSQISLVLDAV